MVELKYEPDVPVPKRRQRVRLHRLEILIADPDGPLVDRIESAEHVQQRALPHTRGADDRDHLSFVDGEIEAAQHLQTRISDEVAFVDGSGLQERHGQCEMPNAECRK